MNEKYNLPIIGKKYHFFDDGKICESRHYIAIITDIIKYSDINKKVKNIWKNEVNACDWLYSPDTDYFIKASIPDYDENQIWFVRTLDGGWFSLNVNNSWQSGRLDIDGKIFKKYIEKNIIINTLDFIKEGREYVKTPVLKAALNLLDKEDIESHIALAFKNGAEYALENQWISVKDDLPYNHNNLVMEGSFSYTKKVLTTNITGKFFIDYMVKYHNGWEWNSDLNIFLPEELKTTFWMPIPKLPTDNSKTL